MKIAKLVVALAVLKMSTGVAWAQEVVVNAVAPTSDDYALAVVWSNLQAKTGSNNSLTVVDNSARSWWNFGFAQQECA